MSGLKEIIERATNLAEKIFDKEGKNIIEEGYGFRRLQDKNLVLVRIMRAGEKEGQRNGVWFEVIKYPEQKPSYLIGHGSSGIAGVGGRQAWKGVAVLENPLVIDVYDLPEWAYPIRAAKYLGIKIPKQIRGETSFARIENQIVKKLSERGYDGIIFVNKHENGMVIPNQVFIPKNTEAYEKTIRTVHPYKKWWVGALKFLIPLAIPNLLLSNIVSDLLNPDEAY